MYIVLVRANCEKMSTEMWEANPVFAKAKAERKVSSINPQSYDYKFATVKNPTDKSFSEVTVLEMKDEKQHKLVENGLSSFQLDHNQINTQLKINLQTSCYSVKIDNGKKLLYFVQAEPEGSMFELLKLENGAIRHWLQEFRPFDRVLLYKKLLSQLKQLKRLNFPLQSIALTDFLIFGSKEKFVTQQIDPLDPKIDDVILEFYPQRADERYISAYQDQELHKPITQFEMMSKLKDLIMHVECHPTNDAVSYSIEIKNPQENTEPSIFDGKTPNPDDIFKCEPTLGSKKAKILKKEIQNLLLFLEKNWYVEDLDLTQAFVKKPPQDPVVNQGLQMDQVMNIGQDLNNQEMAIIHKSNSGVNLPGQKRNIFANKRPIKEKDQKIGDSNREQKKQFDSALKRPNLSQNMFGKMHTDVSEKIQESQSYNPFKQSQKSPFQSSINQIIDRRPNKYVISSDENPFGINMSDQDDLPSPEFPGVKNYEMIKPKKVDFSLKADRGFEGLPQSEVLSVQKLQGDQSNKSIVEKPMIHRRIKPEMSQEEKNILRAQLRESRRSRFGVEEKIDEQMNLEPPKLRSINDPFVVEPVEPISQLSALKKYIPNQNASALKGPSIISSQQQLQKNQDVSQSKKKGTVGCCGLFSSKPHI